MTSPRDTPNPATSTRPRESSKRVAHKKPLAWLPLALLALLLLVALLIFGLIALANDDDDDSSASASPTSTSTGAATSGNGATSPTSGQGAGSAGAPLTVAGQDLIALSDGSLATQNGKPATGTGTGTVESVVSDEGFWVGPSKSARVFVFLTPAARQSNGESGFQVAAGQNITLTGQVVTVTSAPSSTSGVTDSEGKAQLVKQGAFVRADTVALS